MSWLSALSTILGGIGLFLLGMALMTDGLKALAGARLRDYMAGLSKRPRNALIAGFGVTALVQSSSATTLATLGFVSAGILPFQTAISVIVGANIGTTSTGWLVALLGLKFSIAKLAMPIVGIGALMRIIGRDQLAQAGGTIAGFGMIFIGIDFLQAGMEGLAGLTDPTRLQADGFSGRLLLVGFGVMMTVIMQSSSAAVATTLAALAGGALNLEQAAALVIGQNVGTTITAVIGSIGAGVQARRTAAVHVIFNLLTASVAVAVLPIFTGAVAAGVERIAPNDPAITIAAFHTAFNLLGALLFLPISRRVGHWVQERFKEHESGLTSHLGRTVSQVPDVANRAGRDALLECLNRLLWVFSSHLGGIPAAPAKTLDDVRDALPRISSFLARVSPIASSAQARQKQVDLLHCIDHLEEVVALHSNVSDKAGNLHPSMESLREHALKIIESVRTSLHEDGHAQPKRLKRLKQSIAQARYDKLASQVDTSQLDAHELLQLMEAQHWIEQNIYHLWRGLKHLEAANGTLLATETDSEPQAAGA